MDREPLSTRLSELAEERVKLYEELSLDYKMIIYIMGHLN